MGWFNYYGLAVMAAIMIPNVVYAVTHKGEAPEAYRNRAAIIAEQIGRYGCFVFMIFNVPYTYFNFWFGCALTVYLSVNGGLCAGLSYLLDRLSEAGRQTESVVAIRDSLVYFYIQRDRFGESSAACLRRRVCGLPYSHQL